MVFLALQEGISKGVKIMREKKAELASFVLIGVMLASLFAGAVSGAGVSAGGAEEEVDNITIKEAEEMLNSQNVVVLDVRAQAEYESGHIARAKLIPVSELEGGIDELDKGKNIIVYCGSGGRSAKASEILVKYGFEDVYCMLGGITAWIDAGLPTTSFPNSQTPLLFMPNNNSLSSEIDDILADESVFVFFYADWCHFCRQQMPIIDQLEEEYAGKLAFIHINVTERPDYAEEFGVSAIPTMFVISDKKGEGYAKEEISGFTEQTRLREIIALGREDGSDDIDNDTDENPLQAGKDYDAVGDVNVISSLQTTRTTCYSCEDCTDKLKSGLYDEVILTTDITDHAGSCIGLILGESNVVFDCNGHTIDGDDFAIDPEHGVAMMHGTGNTIKNCVISDFSDGIYLWDATNHVITNNNVISNDEGIELGWSDSNNINSNTVNDNYNGIVLSNSNSNTINSNTVCKNTNSDFLIESGTGNSGDENVCDRPDDWNDAGTTGCTNACSGTITCDSCADCSDKLSGMYDTVMLTIDITNHAGTCIIFGASDVVFDGDGHRIDGDDSGTDYGIYMSGKSGNTIKNCVVTDFHHGIYLTDSTGNKIDKNTANSNTEDGFHLSSSSGNTIAHYNEANSNGRYGIFLSSSSDNQVSFNDANSNADVGIRLSNSESNMITFNDVLDNNNPNAWGIYLYRSDSNTISRNDVTNNYYGVKLDNSHSNTLDANTVCSNPGTDFDVVGGSSGNSGDHNTCDEPDGWNDIGTTGCTHACVIKGPDLLIIAPENFTPALRPLADHKNATGMPTLMITLGHIYDTFDGADESEKIKRAIERYEKNHDIKYVMLVGDVDKFPVRWVTHEQPNQPETQTYYFPSDLYYADLYDADGDFSSWNFDGDEYFGEHLDSNNDRDYPYSVNADHADLHPDVAVGRVPASHIEELESYVAKVIRYEHLTFDPDSDWFHNVLLLAGNGRRCDPGIHFNNIQNYLDDDFRYEIYLHNSYFQYSSEKTMAPCNRTPGESFADCMGRTGLTEDQINIFEDADGFSRPDSSLVDIGFLGWHDHGSSVADYTSRVNNSDKFTVAFADGCSDGRFAGGPPGSIARFAPLGAGGHDLPYMEVGGRIIQVIFDPIYIDGAKYYNITGCTMDGTWYSIDDCLTLFPDMSFEDDFEDGPSDPVNPTPMYKRGRPYIYNPPLPAPLQPSTSDHEFNPEHKLFAKNSASGVETGWVGLVAATKGTNFPLNGELESLFFRSYSEPHSSVSDRNRLGNMWRSMLEYWLKMVFDDTGNFEFTEYVNKYNIGSYDAHKNCWIIESTMINTLFGDPSLRVGGVPLLSDEIPPITTDDTDDDWHGDDVTVTLTAIDRGSPPSGVRMTVYRIDGGDWETGNHLTIEAPSDHNNDGIHTIDYYSVDFLGNEEAEQSATVKIETVPPTTDILLDGETPATVVCPDDDPECESGCYNTRVDVSLDTTDDVSGVAYTEYDLTGWPYSRYTEPFSILGGDYFDLITLRYWSVDNAGNAEWPPNEITFCVSNRIAGMIGEEVRILAALKEIVAFRMRKDFVETLPPIKAVKFEWAYADPVAPKWMALGIDHNVYDARGVEWDTTTVPDGDYYIRLTAMEFPGEGMMGSLSQQEDVIYQEQINVTVCNIPNSAYKFKLYAPDEIDRGEATEYTLTFAHKMDQTLTNVNMICDLDAGFFDKIAVLDNGYLNKQGNPSWSRKELKEGETWKVHFKGWTKHDIPPGTVITSQALITADTVPILLSDDPTTPSEVDYTAVAISLINGSITGKVVDGRYGTPIMASVAIDGPVKQKVTTDVNGSYSFSDLLSGVYTVSVYAENYNYHSRDGPVTVTLDGTGASIQRDFFMGLKDTMPPVSSILLSADEIIQENMKEILGTAYDYPPGSGVRKVELCIERNNDRRYWDGNSWERKETWLLVLGTTEWTFNCGGITWDSNFSYAIKSRAIDNTGNVERPTVITTTSVLQSPALISPANNTSVDYISTFEWSYVLDSYYYLQIDNDSDFQSPVIDGSYLIYNTFIPGDLDEGTYYWRVKAVDMERGYPESEWSEVWAVTITLNTITCNSCSDCSNKLNGKYDTVILTNDIINVKGSCITFGANNVVFDGNGYKIDGDDKGEFESGITMSSKSGNTIKNCDITDFESGITLYGSSKNKIYNNKISSNYYDGIGLSTDSDLNNIHDNLIGNNGKYGIYFSSDSNNNIFSKNVVCSNPTDIYDAGDFGSGDDNTCDKTYGWNDDGTRGCTYSCCVIPTDDLYINEDTVLCPGVYDIPDAGATGVIIINADEVVLDCNGATINGTGSGDGIYNYGFDNVTIMNCNVMNYRYGIHVRTHADYNIITNNTVSSNTIAGIELFGSAKYNTITNNTANSNGWGIYLVLWADNNTVVNNIANSNKVDGIRLEDSSCGNIVSANIANLNTKNGIHLENSNNNKIINNTANDNQQHGIFIDGTSTSNTLNSNTFCNNNQAGGNYYDIYDANSTSGVGNTCTTTYIYNDTGECGCASPCAAAPPTCSDGTPYGKCNPSKKPKYCDNGTLIDNCNLCGCDAGLSCNTTSGICYAIPAGDNCSCSTCAECVAKLNDPSCSVVTLTADITNHCGTCITDPAKFTNKIFDCQGHIIDGAGYDYGIFLSGKSGNTIKNCVITDFDEGISLEWGAKNNTIMNSTISSNDYGIYIIAFSNGNTIVDNNILDNNQAGVVISDCESGGYCPGGNTNNTLQGNLIVNNSIGIYSNGSTSIINSNVVCGNTNQDFYSSDWQSSSGDNNTCDCADGWTDNGTTGCSKPCTIKYPDNFSFIEMPDPLSGTTHIIAHENVYQITMKDEDESSRDKR